MPDDHSIYRRQNDEAMCKLLVSFERYCSKMDVTVERMEKTLSLHSDELWGTDDVNIGMKAKVKVIVDSRNEEKQNKVFWRSLISVPVIGLLVDWAYKFFNRPPPFHP